VFNKQLNRQCNRDSKYPALHEYQKVGALFLASNKRAILGDVMGLGKTVQSIAALSHLDNARAIVLCPASVKFQWVREVEKFSDFKAIAIDGDKQKRMGIYGQVANYDIVVINYELLYSDYDTVMELSPQFNVLIADEAQKLKNHDTVIHKMVRGTKRASKGGKVYKGFHQEYMWFLTGTPIENSPMDLFNLMNILDSRVFTSVWHFRRRHVVFGKFNNIVGWQNYEEITRKISPYILRRTIKDVSVELPEAIVSDTTVPMNDDQYNIYEVLRSDFRRCIEMLREGHPMDERMTNRMRTIMTTMMLVADSPELLYISESKYAQKVIRKAQVTPNNKPSPKVEWICDHIESLIENNKNAQAVVFTRSSKFMNIVRRELEGRKITCTTLSGDMNTKSRQESIDTFTSGEVSVFISTEAGSRGINLQCAATLINADIPWNPAVLEQRNGRIVRIGSKHEHAFIYNLYSVDSIDERIRQIVYEKKVTISEILDTDILSQFAS
jgi:SNF2 family DNA or RNA helicase